MTSQSINTDDVVLFVGVQLRKYFVYLESLIPDVSERDVDSGAECRQLHKRQSTA